MKKYPLIFLFLLSAIPALLVSQWSTLYIRHPQETWRWTQGSVDRALLSIRPKGLHFYNDLYLTFSARGEVFVAKDSVEVQYDFTLPSAAIVTDLWLWMEDGAIMRGLLLDRWTASSIYENIVNRRRDPALLMKEYQSGSLTKYTLRIYPMRGDKSRKVKISYLLPAGIQSQRLQQSLPMNLFRSSKYSPLDQRLSVLYWPEYDNSDPKFTAAGLFESGVRVDTVTGKPYYQGTITSANFSQEISFSVANAFSSSVRVEKYSPGGSQGYFQVAFNPSKVFDINTAQKVAAVFEFDEQKSSVGSATLLSNFKSFIQSSFTAKDSFNLIFSGSTITRAKSSGWYGGDSASIEQAFNALSVNVLLNANNMSALLNNAADFVKENNGSVIWLLAASDKLSDYSVANPLIKTIVQKTAGQAQIFVTDVSSYSVGYTYLNNTIYYGNDYLYANLTRQTGGTHTSYRQQSNLTTNLQTVLDDFRGSIQSFDMITRIENGFCSNRFNVNVPATGNLPLDRTVGQVGKYSGTFPFVIELAGYYKGNPISKKILFLENEIQQQDSTLVQMWAGNQVAALEAQLQTNAVVKSVIDVSMTHRVLSKYTAFLALEPNDSLKACTTCRDESKLVNVSDNRRALIPANDSLITAYPNPFNPSTSLRLRLPYGADPRHATVTIFNMLGQEVRRLEIGVLSSEQYSVVRWDGNNSEGKQTGSGIYIATLATDVGRYSVKLVKMK